MAGGSKSHGRALVIGLFIVGLAIFGGGAALGYKFNDTPEPQFVDDIARAGLALGTGLILGGALKFMLEAYQRGIEQRGELQELCQRLWAELRDVHDRTENARLTLQAHRSAEAYNQLMGDLIGCEVRLRKVKRTLDLRRDDLPEVDQDGRCLAATVGYLRTLQREYKNNYLLVVDCQRYDQALNNERLRLLAAADAPLKEFRTKTSHYAWTLLTNERKFPLLDDLTNCGPKYVDHFRQPLHELTRQLLGTRNMPQVGPEFDANVDRVVGEIERTLKQAVEQDSATPDDQEESDEDDDLSS
jgi:hypothetical protein